MITYKMVKKRIGDWNENHPETPLKLSIYNGYYHIGYAGPNGSMDTFIVQSGPGATLEAFEVWRNGYFKGMEMAKK